MRVEQIDVPVTITAGAGATTGTGYLPVGLRGMLGAVRVEVPQMDGTTTVTITIHDEDDVAMFTKASVAENATTVLLPSDSSAPDWGTGDRIPIHSGPSPWYAKIVASGAQTSADMTTGVRLYVFC